MSNSIRFLFLGFVLLVFVLIVVSLKKGKNALKIYLPWMGLGLFYLILTLFPSILTFFRKLFGFESETVTMLVFLLIGTVLIGLLLMSIASRQGEKLNTLAQSEAILEKRVRELESKQDD